MSTDGLAARLLATFLDELDEQVRALNAGLLALETQPNEPERVKTVFRVFHTLKGAARAANVPLVESVCHALETLLADARDGRMAFAPEQFALLFGAADALADAGRRIRGGETLDDSPLAELSHRLASGRAEVTPTAPTAPSARAAPPPEAPRASSSAVPAASNEGGGASAVGTADSPSQPSLPEGHVRVRSEKLDALLASAGQLLTTAGRAEWAAEELEGLREFAARWAADWRRKSGELRSALDRKGDTVRSAAALEVVDNNLRRLVEDTSRLAQTAVRDSHSLARGATDLMDRARRLRMRPFGEAVEVLPRVVRDLAAETGKEVELSIVGGEVEADRIVLDGLREALLHLVRNAVDHGIESPSLREQRGKPAGGTITVSAGLRGDSIVVTVSDDGSGLDLAAIRANLAARGIAVPADPRALARALFEGGVSTRAETTAISGRGVGLDVVKAVTDRIHGTVDVRWQPGRGTTFTMSAPLTLASVRAVVTTVGAETVAIPTNAIERLLRVWPEELRLVEAQRVLPTPEGPVPITALARLLGPPFVEKPVVPREPLYVVSMTDGAGDRRLAVVVDSLVEEDELLLRPIERLSHTLPHIAGAALLPTGRVSLVVNPAALLKAGIARAVALDGGLAVAEGAPAERMRRRILVVDDSITTRTLEESVLHAAGYEVSTAVDGDDAWRHLQEHGADLVVADVQMPRMDGIALTEAIRRSTRWRALPVVLVTALESPEDQARGLEAGADAYVVKSSFDQEALLDTIRQLLR